MTIEIALLLSLISVSFGVFSAIASFTRAKKADEQKDTSELTTVIVKLENISSGVAEIKADNKSIKGEVKDMRDRLIIVEQSSKQAHKRIDDLKGAENRGKEKDIN